MNRTQKGAWFLLGGAVLSLTLMGIFYVAIFATGVSLAGIRLMRFGAGLLVVYMVVSVVLVRRRQSPVEPESDERDNAIKKNAPIACFASVWASLALASYIPSLVVGQAGSIPVFLLPIINLIILYVAFIVYGIAVLHQYARAENGEAS